MKSNKLVFSLLSLLLLASCGGHNSDTSGSNDTGTSSSEPEKVELDTMSALSLIASEDASFRIAIDDGSVIEKFKYYTPNYYLRDDSTGYLNENGGVSKIRYDEEKAKLHRSELLTDSKGELVPDYRTLITSFKDLDLSLVTVDAEGVANLEKGKANTVALINVLELDSSMLFSIQSFTAQYIPGRDKTSPNGLTFTSVFKVKDDKGNSVDQTYVITVGGYENVKVSYLDEFLKNPTAPFEPTAAEKRVRKLFRKNNYINGNDLDGDGTIDEHYYFHPQYFYTDFTEEYTKKDPETALAYGNRGYLSIISKTMLVNSKPLMFLGTYLFYHNDEVPVGIVTREDPNNPGFAQSSFTQIYTDITEVMNYPTRMLSLNNFEDATVTDEGYIRYDGEDVLYDFIDNHSLTEQINELGLVPTHLLIIPDLKENDADCKVTFQLRCDNDRYFEFVYSDFGEANRDFIDSFIIDYDLAID